MAHEARAVNGTWCFPPRLVLTVVFSLQCPLWVTSVPSQIPHVGVEVEGQTSQGHHALPLPWRSDLMETRCCSLGTAAGDNVSPGVFCLESPCLPLASLSGEFWDSLPMESWLVLAKGIPQLCSRFRWEIQVSSCLWGCFKHVWPQKMFCHFYSTERQLIAGRLPLAGEGCSQIRGKFSSQIFSSLLFHFLCTPPTASCVRTWLQMTP